MFTIDFDLDFTNLLKLESNKKENLELDSIDVYFHVPNQYIDVLERVIKDVYKLRSNMYFKDILKDVDDKTIFTEFVRQLPLKQKVTSRTVLFVMIEKSPDDFLVMMDPMPYNEIMYFCRIKNQRKEMEKGLRRWFDQYPNLCRIKY